MMKNKIFSRVLAITLCVVMALGSPVMTRASSPISTGGEIIAFEALPSETANQEVAIGTSIEELRLPDNLMVTVRVETAVEDSFSIPVTWDDTQLYGSQTPGSYVFSPELPAEYSLSEGVAAPVITVTVKDYTVTNSVETATGAALGDSVKTATGAALTASLERASGTGWSLDDAGKLTITSNFGVTNWNKNTYKDQVKSVDISSGVTAINYGAFSGCTKLIEVTISNSVTSIGQQAFSDCTSLQNITLPQTLTIIETQLFQNCSSLSSITIPAAVTTIGISAFLGCLALAQVTIPDSVKSIGQQAFKECTALKSITLSQGLRTIDANAFRSCTSLNSITIPAAVTTIGAYAFIGCASLAQVIISDSVTSIGLSAFSGCIALTQITLPSSMTTIGGSAFLNCTALTQVNIPAAVTTIGTYAFSGCISLTQITLPSSVTTIEASTFYRCIALTQVTIPDSVTTIGSTAFSNCTALNQVIIPDSVTSIGMAAFRECTSLVNITLPQTLTDIAGQLFLNCRSLSSIIIPNGVRTIGDYAFMGCVELEQVTIPNLVTAIGSYAFNECDKLDTIIIPATVKQLGISSFSGCNELTTVTFESVTPPTIGTNIFHNCSMLNKIYVPADSVVAYKAVANLLGEQNKITAIINNTGWNIDNDGKLTITSDVGMADWVTNKDTYKNQVKVVVIENGVTSISNNAFYGCTSLTQITIPDSVTIIGNSVFPSCTALTQVTIPDSVTTIGHFAFSDCTALTQVTIPDSVTAIGVFTFSGCSALTEITIADSVINIGMGSFRNCVSLENITLPQALTSIEEQMFQGCSSLSNIILPDSVTTIKDYAFSDCVVLTKVSIPDSVTIIGMLAFEDCDTFENIIIPETVTQLGARIFYDCNELTTVTFENVTPPAIDIEILNSCLKLKKIFVPVGSENAYKAVVNLSIYKDMITSTTSDTGWNLDNDGKLTITSDIGMSDWVTNKETYKDQVMSVVIENGVTSISDNAFYQCENLTEIIIPDSVTMIGSYAFGYCYALENILIPSSVTLFNQYVFSDCNELTTVTFESVIPPAIGDEIFYSCSKLTKIYVPVGSVAAYKAVTNLSPYQDKISSAISDTSWNIDDDGNLTITHDDGMSDWATHKDTYKDQVMSVVIENGVTSISDYAFSGCTNLTEITIPNSVTTIGGYAFSYCNVLTQVTIPDSVSKIGYFAFGYCNALENIIIPASVTYLSMSIFGYCSKLTTVTFESVTPPTTIGTTIFYNCLKLKKIYVPVGSEHAYKAVANLLIYKDMITSTTSDSGWNLDNDGKLTITCDVGMSDWVTNKDTYKDQVKVIDIENGVTGICNNAFSGATNLTEITIPDSVTMIGDFSFMGCSSLIQVTIPNTVTNIGLQAFKNCTSLENITLPQTLTILEEQIFIGCSSLSSITIPDFVTTIKDYAFSGCVVLEEVTIPDSVTRIGSFAFDECDTLETIIIPAAVTQLGPCAFMGCNELTTVTFERVTPPTIGIQVFDSCTKLKAIYVPFDSVATYKAVENMSRYKNKISATINGTDWNLDNDGKLTITSDAGMLDWGMSKDTYKDQVKVVFIENGVTIVNETSFFRCTNLTEVTIPKSVTAIGTSAFSGCTALKQITIPDAVTSIGPMAFGDCTSLENITLPQTLTILESEIFHGCNSLSSITIPDSVTRIGDFAFADCFKLEQVTIPDSVTHIGSCAFEDCDRFETIIIPASVMQLGSDVFYDCNILTTVTFESITPPTIGDKIFNSCSKLKKVYVPFGSEDIYKKMANLSIYKDKITSTISDTGWYIDKDGKLMILNDVGMSDWEQNKDSVKEQVKVIVIENGVTSISNNAFAGCTKLTEITIPNSATTIGTTIFQGCDKLVSIYVPSGSVGTYKSMANLSSYKNKITCVGNSSDWNLDNDGNLTIASDAGMVSWSSAHVNDPNRLAVKTITINEGVTFIGNDAFYNCMVMTDIQISESVSSIGTSAFFNCKSLAEFELPSGVTNIDVYAFALCVALTTVTFQREIPPMIGIDIFFVCSSLNKIFVPFGSEDAYKAVINLSTYKGKITSTILDAGWYIDNSGKLTILNDTGMTNWDLKKDAHKDQVKVIDIKNGVTEISSNAFSECMNMTEITLPNSVTTIGDSAFSSCTALTQVTLPDSVTTIGSSAFSNCTALTQVIIPDSVTTIQSSAFSGCRALTQVTLPDSVINIGQGVFRYCTSLENITLPQTLTRIEEQIFFGCSALSNITIPDSVTSIGDSAFSECVGLEQLTLPDSLIEIDSYAFEDCDALENIIIPAMVTELSSKVFYGCNKLTTVTFESEIPPTIGTGIFTNCLNLTKIYVPFGSEATYKAVGNLSSNINKITSKITDTGWYVDNNGKLTILSDTGMSDWGLNGNSQKTQVKVIVIENSVTGISDNAFSGCVNLTEITIPNSVKSIGTTIFNDCDQLVTIYVPSGSVGSYKSVTNLSSYKDKITCIGNEADCTLDTDGKLMITSDAGMASWRTVRSNDSTRQNVTTVTIQEGVTFIANGAFENCTALTEIDISGSVSSIGINVFYNCQSLTEVEIPSSVTSISDHAFNMSTALKTVTFESETPPTIGTEIFSGCDKLEKIYVPFGYEEAYKAVTNLSIYNDKVTSVISDAGWYIDTNGKLTILSDTGMTDWDQKKENYKNQVKVVVINNGVTAISNNAFSGCTNLTEVIIPDSVKMIGNGAFFECTALMQVTIPDLVTMIGYSAFASCTALKQVTIPDSVINIGFGAFRNCASLENITLPGNLTRIEEQMLQGCSSLSSIMIPDSVTLIGDYAFSGCSALGQITIPDLVTQIGLNAFDSCDELENIVIPEKVTQLSSNVFYGCDKLTTVTFESKTPPTTIGTEIFNNCSKLTKIYVPFGSEDAYKAVENLSIYKDWITSIISETGWYIDNSGKLTIISDAGMSDWVVKKDTYKDQVKSVVIENGVTSFSNNAFSGCSNLTEITIPDSVTEIGTSIFDGCDKLENIYVPAGSVGTYKSVVNLSKYKDKITCVGIDSDWRLDDDGNLTITSDAGMASWSLVEMNDATRNNVKTVTINEDVTFIGNNAFKNCIALTDIEISENVSSIGMNAFYNCQSLAEVEIPGGVTSISDHAFNMSAGLITVTFESEIPPTIGTEIFSGCNKLEKIYVPFGYEEAYKEVTNLSIYNDKVTSVISDTGWYIDNNGKLTILSDAGMTDWILKKDTYKDQVQNVVIENGVTGLSDNVFSGCTNLIEVTIPDSVTTIGNSAFSGCTSLIEVTIPDSVTMIGNSVFSGCTALIEVTIPDSVTTIGNSAFSGCTALTEITIPDSVTTIGYSVFSGCTALTEITIPDSVITIGDSAFSGCTALTEVTIPDSVTTIGNSTFSDCTALTEITIPDSVTSIGQQAFRNCTSLENITLSQTLEAIEVQMFEGCSTLSSITIPESVITIGNYAFSGCTALTEITISDSVTSIGDSAFKNCDAVEDIIIPATVTQLSPDAFSGCNELTTVTFKSEIPPTIGTGIFTNCPNLTKIYVPFGSEATYKAVGNLSSNINKITSTIADTGWYIDNNGKLTILSDTGMSDWNLNGDSVKDQVKVIVIENGVTGISDNAFSGCVNLTEITIPDSVTVIGTTIFDDCDRLVTIYVPVGSVGTYKSVESLSSYVDKITCEGNVSDWTLDDDGKLTITSDAGMASWSLVQVNDTTRHNVKTVTINKDVTFISNTAFYNCVALTDIKIPDSIGSIGINAFYNCSSLTEVELPSSVTYIGDHAFAKSTALKTVTFTSEIPPTVETEIFNGCSNLKKIYVPFSSEDAYKKVTNLSTYKDKVTSTISETGWYIDNSGKLTIISEAGMADWIMNGASYKDQVKVVVIEHGVTSIKDNAFSGCTNLTGITIPDTVTTIGNSAFSGCTALTGITIPDSVTNIGNSAFSGCTALTQVTIPDSVTSIGQQAFRDCTSLENITLPQTLTIIEAQMFQGCSSLSSITIPESVTTIGNFAFLGCTALTQVTIPDSVTSIGQQAFRDCTSLENITLSQTLTIIEAQMFQGCSSLSSITIPDSVTSIGDSAFRECTSLDNIIIPKSVTQISAYAFSNCSSLTTVTFESTTPQTIDTPIFDGCDRLVTIYVPVGSVGTYKSVESLSSYVDKITCEGNVSDWTLDDDGKLTITSDAGMASWSLVQVNDTTRHNVKTVTINKDVTFISNAAFYNCVALTDIKIPDSIGSIGINAFYNCSSLTDIEIPSSVTYIGDRAFAKSTELKTVTFKSEIPPTLGTEIFTGCSNLERINVPIGCVSNYKGIENLRPYNGNIVETPKPSVNNVGGLAEITYIEKTIDLSMIAGLFVVDENAGAQTYTVEIDGSSMGVGTIGADNKNLTVTKAGTIKIGLTTAETDTYAAGEKVIAILTVNKGRQSAPTNFGKADATTYGGNDGKITGLIAGIQYEYKEDDGSYQKMMTSVLGEITGLTAGDYVVRFAESDLYNASVDSVSINIGQAAPKSENSIKGITGLNGAVIQGTKIIASVSSTTNSQTINLEVSSGASWALYSDFACQQEITSKTISLNVGANTAYVKITAENGTSQVYTLIISRESTNSGGESSGGSSGELGSSNGENTPSSPNEKPTVSIIGGEEIIASVNKKGNASTTVTTNNIISAIADAMANAEKKGVTIGEITVSINISMGGKNANNVIVNLPKITQQEIINNKIAGLELTFENPNIVLRLNNLAITEINQKMNANVQLAATKIDSSKLGKEAKSAIGNRPTYDFSAKQQNGKSSMTDFGNGTVYVSIPYTPAPNEIIGYLYAVYVDSNGKVSRVPGSAYDVNSKSIIFITNHFSTYGISYSNPTKKLKDITNHWAKNSIDFVVGLGLLDSTSKSNFSPNATMTRGTLVTALGKLADVNTKLYSTNSFSDIKANSSYLPYIEWAYQKGIIQGIKGGMFEPDRAVTREEIAEIFKNYAKATSYILPVIREERSYVDASNIGAIYKDAVKAMQQAGIMMGNTDNNFKPKANITRAEVAVMLYRYIKLTIDPGTALGWTMNDAGQYLYYMDGKAFTGWQDISVDGKNETYYFTKDGLMVSSKWLEIEGKWYYFKDNGTLAKNTKVGDYEVDESGVRKTK